MRVRTPHPKVCKLACKAQGVGVFAKGEIPVAFGFSPPRFGGSSFLEQTPVEPDLRVDCIAPFCESAECANAGSHTPPEDLQARLQGAGCGCIRAKREIPVAVSCKRRYDRGVEDAVPYKFVRFSSVGRGSRVPCRAVPWCRRE